MQKDIGRRRWEREKTIWEKKKSLTVSYLKDWIRCENYKKSSYNDCTNYYDEFGLNYSVYSTTTATINTTNHKYYRNHYYQHLSKLKQLYFAQITSITATTTTTTNITATITTNNCYSTTTITFTVSIIVVLHCKLILYIQPPTTTTTTTSTATTTTTATPTTTTATTITTVTTAVIYAEIYNLVILRLLDVLSQGTRDPDESSSSAWIAAYTGSINNNNPGFQLRIWKAALFFLRISSGISQY